MSADWRTSTSPSTSASSTDTRWWMRRLYWSMRRELWENRSIYVAPLLVAALALAASSVVVVQLPQTIRETAALGALQQREALVRPYTFAAYLLMATTFVVAIFYCLDALQGERRDRSVLFWKSLPVSDTMTVLAKASVPLVILPLMAVALTLLVQLIVLLVSSAVLLASGIDVATLWTNVSFFRMSWLLLYHMVAGHGLWYAPIYAWLLLVSAWSRRAAFLWAALPPLVIAVVERIAFNSTRMVDMLTSRLSGGPASEVMNSPADVLDPMMTHVMLWDFVSSPGLWLGLLVSAAFLASAIRLRQNSAPL
jgi:ABC-2 type transport system permease protein